MYDEFSTVYIDYLANYQTGVTRPTENTGEVITRWQRKSGFFDVSHNGKRKLTAVCSHQTRIGNLDAHLI